MKMEGSLVSDTKDHILPPPSELSESQKFCSVSTSTPFISKSQSNAWSSIDSGYSTTPLEGHTGSSIHGDISAASWTSEIPKLHFGHEEEIQEQDTCSFSENDYTAATSAYESELSPVKTSSRHVEDAPNAETLSTYHSKSYIKSRCKIDPEMVNNVTKFLTERKLLPASSYLIGSKMGLKKMDIINELEQIYPAVRLILMNLEPLDICR